MKTIIKNKYTWIALGIFFLFLIWIISSAIINNSYILPSLSLTFKALGNILADKSSYSIIGNTFLKSFIAILASAFIAILLAYLSLLSNKVKFFFKPGMVLLKTLPIVVVIIIFILFFKADIATEFIVSVVVIPIIYESTLEGITTINKEIVDCVRLDSNINFNVITKVHFPIAFPFFITSLVQSFGLGLKVMVMAEYITQAKNSIGYEFQYYKNISMEMEYLFAWSIILVAIILIIELIIKNIEKRTSI